MEYIFSLSVHGYKVFAMFWNIGLLAVTVFTAHYLYLIAKERYGGKRKKPFRGCEWAGVFILIFFWLFMFPNTAYQFTVVRHLVDLCDDFDKHRVCTGGIWVVIFFFTYAFLGLPAFWYSLKRISQTFSLVFGSISGNILPFVTLPLTTIGVFLGLFERLNSWDMLVRPFDILRILLAYFSDMARLFDFIVFTVCLFFIYYSFDYFICLIKKK